RRPSEPAPEFSEEHRHGSGLAGGVAAHAPGPRPGDGALSVELAPQPVEAVDGPFDADGEKSHRWRDVEKDDGDRALGVDVSLGMADQVAHKRGRDERAPIEHLVVVCLDAEVPDLAARRVAGGVEDPSTGRQPLTTELPQLVAMVVRL